MPSLPFSPQAALLRCIDHREIFPDEMTSLMRQIMSGDISPAVLGALLMGLRVKKETIGEIAAAATVMREFSVPVPDIPLENLIDLCGTGGDGAHTFNISTAAMFVTAAAGARVAKHGGRAVSSHAGSADVLEALGVVIDLPPMAVAASIAQVGIGFMYAPRYHPAMKYAAPVRRELGVRTLFNILGPLTNPAGAPHQLMGVFHPDLVGIQLRVLQQLGSRHALVVHGTGKDLAGGLDEFSLSGPTLVGELKDGQMHEYTCMPEDFGLPSCAARLLQVNTVQDAQALLLAALTPSTSADTSQQQAARNIVVLNAGAALYAADVASTLAEGIHYAHQAIDSHGAFDKIKQLIDITQQLAHLEKGQSTT